MISSLSMLNYALHCYLWDLHGSCSALGVASSVISFVDFAAELISATKVILHSKEGASADNLALEKIYTQLQALSSHLKSSISPLQSPPSSQPLNDMLVLRELSVACNKDYQEIIDVLQTFKVQDKDHQFWRSMKAAF